MVAMPVEKAVKKPRKVAPAAEVDPDAGRAAFERLMPRLDKIPAERLQAVRTGVDAAAIVALGIASELNQPKSRALFEQLPSELFDIADLDDLGPAALATWHAATQLLSASAQGSEAKLPVALVDEATRLRTRMLRVIDYHFEPDMPQGREAADIRSGTGYRDLAQDLTRLAVLYRDNAAALKADTIRYRVEDAARGDALAGTILKELSAARNTEQKRWAERVMQAWALLSDLYAEVTATAAWLRRRDEAAPRYPSLFAAGRAAPRRGREADEELPEASAPDEAPEEV